MYNNNYNGYNRNNYGAGSPQRVSFYPSRQKRKHSGCVQKLMSDGVIVLSAWKYNSKEGLMSFYARPYKGTKKHSSQNGKTFLNYFVTIVNKRSFTVIKTSGLLCLETKKLTIPDFGLVLNPNAPNGGYCGSFTRKK